MDWMGAENFHSITGDTRHRSLLHKVLSTVFHDARVGYAASWVRGASPRQGRYFLKLVRFLRVSIRNRAWWGSVFKLLIGERGCALLA
jgi:hypothetical protein